MQSHLDGISWIPNNNTGNAYSQAPMSTSHFKGHKTIDKLTSNCSSCEICHFFSLTERQSTWDYERWGMEGEEKRNQPLSVLRYGLSCLWRVAIAFPCYTFMLLFQESLGWTRTKKCAPLFPTRFPTPRPTKKSGNVGRNDVEDSKPII